MYYTKWRDSFRGAYPLLTAFKEKKERGDCVHELSIVFYVVESVEELAEENGFLSVNSVTLELGEVSGVVAMFLQDCWPMAVEDSRCLKDSQLICKTLPAVTVCNSCGMAYGTVAHGKICPHCKSKDTVLLTGNEVSIKEIEVPF
jgi:hydrogenase nickel incorporation protein HypA/HybF